MRWVEVRLLHSRSTSTHTVSPLEKLFFLDEHIELNAQRRLVRAFVKKATNESDLLQGVFPKINAVLGALAIAHQNSQ